jgi:threonine/homoserine/homoserine lactone efflux protein
MERCVFQHIVSRKDPRAGCHEYARSKHDCEHHHITQHPGRGANAHPPFPFALALLPEGRGALLHPKHGLYRIHCTHRTGNHLSICTGTVQLLLPRLNVRIEAGNDIDSISTRLERLKNAEDPIMTFPIAGLLTALPAAGLFALVTSITPGPNNTMLLASGVNFGLRRTVPHLLGISAGVAFLMILVGIGLAQAFARFAWLYTVLETASVAYLLYLAWKIATSSTVQVRAGERRPMRFFEAVAFQWINPKAWMMVLTAATTIHLHASLSLNAALLALVFVVVGFPCITMWAACGVSLRRFLGNPRRLRLFNWTMATLLVLSLYPVVERALA